MTNTLEQKIEALLFWKNEGVTIKWLAKTLEVAEEEIKLALELLDKNLEGRGVILQKSGEEVAIKTSPEASSLIEKLSKEELVKELTPSALETISIIVYHGPISKKEIDYIRGVNSGFILRNLLVRGLIEKTTGSDARVSYYKPTMDLLSFLGISKIEDLEEYESVRKEIEEFKNAQDTD